MKIESQLKVQRSQAQTLEHNDQRLGKLITGLDAAIAQQREAERLAQEQRRAEAQRRAQEARRQALERKRAIQRQQEAARQAQLAASQAQEQAQNERDEQDAKKAREQVEQARAQARVAEQAAREADKAKPVPAAQAPTAQGAQALGGSGLKKGLRYPVQGEVQGRFGMGRPDGGLWRGIVLRAAVGTPVHVVADGRVVYANWLRGFGNIMIVDHGDKYLTIYAYNQSLLKRVGDFVHAGETIATVGATGGQVESGLYFEIRHQGTPVNPLLWLSH